MQSHEARNAGRSEHTLAVKASIVSTFGAAKTHVQLTEHEQEQSRDVDVQYTLSSTP